jgi:hypothetical protein
MTRCKKLNGVLKMTLPKRPEVAGAQRKIEIKKS